MSTQTQFGQTLFLNRLEDSSAAQRLNRLHFSKNSSETGRFDEAWLQRLIMHNPSLLPVDQIEPAFNTMVPICIELPMRCGYLDNLFVTPSGDLALVECKLWRNPEARREVVAQIIDYAKEISTWNYETLQEAIRHTKPLDGANEKRTLYELVSANGETDEISFHDTLSRNLKRGRFLLLIVGDGIREGVESMAEFLQQHAGFHFTLAFVEIALFEAPGGYIAQPRILARTTNIDRGVVTLDEGRIVISPPKGSTASSEKKTTITQERYFEQLENHFPGIPAKLNAFTDSLAPYNVVREFGNDCMILRWRPGDGRNWNLGSITSRGEVWMDYLGQQANNAGLLEIYKQYLTKLAQIVPDAHIKQTRKETAWNVAHNGKIVTVGALLVDENRMKAWVHAIADLQTELMKSIPG
jgi:hypothetical protein